MREKKRYLVVSFQSTTQAMAFEKKAKSEGLAGRMIPVPSDITSGCGLAWRDDLAARKSVEEMVDYGKVGIDGIFELIL